MEADKEHEEWLRVNRPVMWANIGHSAKVRKDRRKSLQSWQKSLNVDLTYQETMDAA